MTRRWAAVTAAAALLWLGSWWLLHHGFWTRDHIVDTPTYEAYGRAMREGLVPYRDFSLEYPPGALPAFVAPELTARPNDFASYAHDFERWMAGCGVVMVVLVAVGLALLEVPVAASVPPLALVALSPLLLGSLVLSRFDLWPATLAVAGVVALLGGLDLVGAIVLGLAVSAKLWPAVLVPIGAVWIWRRAGLRRAAVWSAVLIAVVAAVFLPFAIIAPGGLGHALGTQAGRPLQIESLGAATLIWAHHVFGVGVTVATDHGSQNIEGGAARAVGVATTLLQVLVVAAAWLFFARGPASKRRLVLASAAAVAGLVAFGKVFSPQFMLWLVPLVPLVRGPRGRVASALLATALVLTQFWFPFRYWRLPLRLDPTVSTIVLLRDLVVVAIALILVERLRRNGQPSRPTSFSDAAERPH